MRARPVPVLTYSAQPSPCWHPRQDGLLLAPLGLLGESLVAVNGVGYALGAVVLFTLKDAAARGRLGASTFRALNIGGSRTGSGAGWAEEVLGEGRSGVLWAAMTRPGMRCSAAVAHVQVAQLWCRSAVPPRTDRASRHVPVPCLQAWQ